MFRKTQPHIAPVEEVQPVTETPLRVGVMDLLRNLVRQTQEQAHQMPTSQKLMLQTFSGLILAKVSTLPDADLRQLVLAIATHSADLARLIPIDDRS